jgi:anti-sigma factor RsiW
MTTPRLSPDDARALFSDHVEGFLDAATRTAVDEVLARDLVLAAEYRRFANTVTALRGLPRPAVPVDLAARVRARIAAEDAVVASPPAASSASASSASASSASASSASASSASGAAATSSAVALASTALAPANDVLPLHRALNDELAQARPRKRFGVEFFAAVGSIAAVLAIVAVGVPVFNGRAFVRGDGDGIVTAGLASSGTVDVTWRAPGLPRSLVTAAARQAGLSFDVHDRFVGDRDAVAGFLVALKTLGAQHGVDVAGSVPTGVDRVAVVVAQ